MKPCYDGGTWHNESETDDLLVEVERLKTLTSALEHELSFTRQQLAIERQRAADCQVVILELTEKAAELRAALEPLASVGDVEYLSSSWEVCGLKRADVRRAKRALGVV